MSKADNSPRSLPRLVIAGVSSGSGKTSVTMGLIRCLKAGGFDVSPFKAGPDYIDPGHLEAAAEVSCRNLDPLLMGKDAMIESLFRASSPEGIAVIEGVMGLYDGKDGREAAGSTADIAKTLGAPVIVIIDAKASAQTAGAVALGIKLYDPECPVAGFILNRIGSPRHFDMVRSAVEGATDLPVFGWVPKDSSISLPERHLGLVAAWENKDADDPESAAAAADRIAGLLDGRIDIDRLRDIARNAPPLPSCNGGNFPCVSPSESSDNSRRVKIGIAMDSAFHFYYRDNLDILESLGAELAEFSPIADRNLPEGISGIYFGGGYPELHAAELSKNLSMRTAVYEAAMENMPIYAECGGLMYLVKGLTTDCKTWPMAGIFDAEIEMTRKLSALGYYTAKTRRSSMLGPEGLTMTGHIYRWSGFTEPVDDSNWLLSIEKEGRTSFDGLSVKSTVASYLHVHFAGSREAGRNFVDACKKFSEGAFQYAGK